VDSPSAASDSDDASSQISSQMDMSVSTTMDRALETRLSSLAKMRQTLGAMLTWSKEAVDSQVPSPGGLVASLTERGETASSIGGDSRTPVQRSGDAASSAAAVPRRPITTGDGGENSDRWKRKLQYHSNPAFDNPFDVAFPEPSDVGSDASSVNLGVALESQLAHGPPTTSPHTMTPGKNRLASSILGRSPTPHSPQQQPPVLDLMDMDLPMPPRAQVPAAILSPDQLSRTFADLRNVVSSIFNDDDSTEEEDPTPRSRI
jgi:hypothetical protein